MGQRAFYYDNSRCTGCKTCEMACKDYKDLSADIPFRRVFDYEGGETKSAADGTCSTTAFMYHLSMACNHCAKPACVEACPQGAVHKDEETGLVLPDDTKCIGCGTCVGACPYGVPQVNPDTKKMVKCDGCYDRVVEGLKPICVGSCPLRALDFGELTELSGKYTDDGPIAPMPESQTVPSVIIKASPAAKKPGDSTGDVANPAEVATIG